MRKYRQAFTLVELMITLAVVSIIAALAAPSFNRQIQNNRSLAVAEEFASAINFARSEALKRGGRVSVCASNNGALCNSANWNTGVIVVIDTAASDTAPAPVVGEVLRVWQDFGDLADIQVSDNKPFVRYISTGRMAQALDNNPVNITVRFQGCTGAGAARVVSIGLSGMVNVARTNCP